MKQDTLQHTMVRLAKKHGFPRINLHGLRHIHDTTLLRLGVHAKLVQERFGHSSISIALDLYSHVTPGSREPAGSAKDSSTPFALGPSKL
ncbi:MAG: tyrosine-type recombinase/integrase [SAR202 cluster bacterium]|nr:tyrosine-type recombinase/integrase [SAR202 cluster bacterium]MDP6512724.1 tyrosine-type recombinase/integrase [SAR202 cluster bacterium]MDP6714403.1 tyrosine-type recombinase/integrase [SAR202 cluster bacterium]